jgi:transcriptional regulator with XRE-family HTH domain
VKKARLKCDPPVTPPEPNPRGQMSICHERPAFRSRVWSCRSGKITHVIELLKEVQESPQNPHSLLTLLANTYNMPVMKGQTLGEKLKLERENRKISLRKFAQKLEISPAYLVDIEKNRRLPTEGVLQKAADLLDIPVSAFDEFSPEIPKPVKNWLKKNPLVEKALRLITKSPAPQETLEQLERSVARRPQRRYPIAIYESELQAIGLESSSWERETGGDLFGIWGDIPVVYLASRAGPQAQRDHAHFRLDVDYLINLSAMLERDWGLRYLGDWHSHHRLGLSTPSDGDERRIKRLAAKNNFDDMAEFIITFTSSHNDRRKIDIHPFLYLDLPSHTLTQAVLIVLKGTSPVRSALIATSSLPEQSLNSFSSFPAGQIRIPTEPLACVPGCDGFLVTQISERLLAKIVSELTTVSVGVPEVHKESFGYIIVVPVNDRENVAFAFDKAWPHLLLEVDWMNRANGLTEELPLDMADLSLLNVEGLKAIFFNAARSRLETGK